MYKINRQKWLAAVQAIEAWRVRRDEVKAEVALTGDWLAAYKDPARKEFVCHRDTDAELTKLYSIRAMARNRIHRKRARNAKGEIRDLGWEDQLAYVGEAWKAYEKVETPTGFEPVTSSLG